MATSVHKETTGHLIRRYIMLFIGASIAAVALELFLVPNNIIDGGVIGVSLLVNNLTGINFGILVLIINIPFLIAGLKRIGKDFLFSSLFSIIVLSVMEGFLHRFTLITDEPLLATVFGGLILGAGVGIVIRNAGALDGTEILGILVTKKLPFSVGEFVMFINVFIFAWAGFVLGWEQAMLSILTYYIASKTIDAVGQGILNETKAAIIVSKDSDDIADEIGNALHRGVTIFYGKNNHKETDTEVLYVVITRLEVAKLKAIVHDIDPTAFTTIMDAQEVHGGRFKTSGH
ncbi:YitT family protein [Oceanobacillus bengalensis]|uniref:YitT family protein n=1 Tax=Oceanobacillus bengalensis TaxID=1435466 RepID=A0A494Z8A6_9BACI|nr:YitT family protein [Oceanobacillus bengalensis]RKQ18257.1 YitT family protein [Oceanobacillus bengalensis]